MKSNLHNVIEDHLLVKIEPLKNFLLSDALYLPVYVIVLGEAFIELELTSEET